jgi:hypothetical protein
MVRTVSKAKTGARTKGKPTPKTQARAKSKPKMREPDAAVAVAQSIQRSVLVASAKAMVAVMLDKPEDQVTGADMTAVGVGEVNGYDREKFNRSIRAGWKAAAKTLDEEGVLPTFLRVHLELALEYLDRGEANGMAKPSPAPRRTKPATARLPHIRLLAYHVHYAMGCYNISKEHAFCSVTGAPDREGRIRSGIGQKVVGIPGAVTYDTLRKLLRAGEKDWGKERLAIIKALGAAVREGYSASGIWRGIQVNLP